MADVDRSVEERLDWNAFKTSRVWAPTRFIKSRRELDEGLAPA